MQCLNHIDGVLIDIPLHKGPDFAHFLRDLGHRVTIKRCLTTALERDPVHVFDIDKLLFYDRDLITHGVHLVQHLNTSEVFLDPIHVICHSLRRLFEHVFKLFVDLEFLLF